MWNIRLTQVMVGECQLVQLITDGQMYCRWNPKVPISNSLVGLKRLELICSTHIDDVKGTGTTEASDKVLTILAKEFGKLKIKGVSSNTSA